DQIPLHMSKTDMGASYSFWLPWDAAGGQRKEVSLICRFEPKTGGVVTSEQTRHLLPGAAPPEVATADPKKPPQVPEGVPMKPSRQTVESMQQSRNADRNARLISYEAPIAGQQPVALAGGANAGGDVAGNHLMSTTIALPQNYQMPDAAAVNASMSSGYQQQ